MIRHHIGIGIVGEMSDIDRDSIGVEGDWPVRRGFFGVGEGIALSEAAPAVAIDDGRFVEEGRTDGWVLDYVVESSERVFIGDLLADQEVRLCRRQANSAAYGESSYGQFGAQQGFGVIRARLSGGAFLPNDMGGFAVIRHAFGTFGVGGRTPAIQAEEMPEASYGRIPGFGGCPSERIDIGAF